MPNTSTQERISLVLDARVSDFERGLQSAADALGRLSSVAQQRSSDFENTVQRSLDNVSKGMRNIGTGPFADDLRNTFNRAKTSVQDFQKNFQRINAELVKSQQSTTAALAKAQQDLALATKNAETDILRIKRRGKAERDRLETEDSPALKKALDRKAQLEKEFGDKRKAIRKTALDEINRLEKQAAENLRTVRRDLPGPARKDLQRQVRDQARLEAKERAIAALEAQRKTLRIDRNFTNVRVSGGRPAGSALPSVQLRQKLIAEEQQLTAAIARELERRGDIARNISARQTRINIAAAAQNARLAQQEAKDVLRITTAYEEEKRRLAQNTADRKKALAATETAIAQEQAKRQTAIVRSSAAEREAVETRLERLNKRRREILRGNVEALAKAKEAEDRYQSELAQSGQQARKLASDLDRLRQRRDEEARSAAAAAATRGGRGGLGGGGGAGSGGGDRARGGSSGQGLNQLNSSINRLRIGILNIQTALGLVGASFGIKESLDLASTFERELAGINTLLVNAQVPIERYRDQLVNLSVVSSKDLIDLTQGLYQTISAGVPAVEGAAGAFELLAQAQKAAVAGNATTRQSVNALITTVKAYADTGITAAEASDKLFTTVRLGRTTFEELSSTIGRILGITANFGLSLDESLGAVATITRVIPSTAESITQLRALIRGIVRPARQVQKVIEEINEQTGASLEFSARALKERGLSGIIREILDATGGDPDVLANLFPNVRALGGAAVLTAGTFRDFVDSLDQLQNSAGATDVALNKVQDTVQEQARILRSRFQKVLIEIGEKSFPLIKRALVDIGDFLENNQGRFESFFSNLLEVLNKVFNFVSNNLDQVIALVETVLLVKFPAFFATLKALGAEEGEGFFTFLKFFVVGQLGSLLVASGNTLGQGIRTIITDLGNNRGPIFGRLAALVGRIGTVLGPLLGTAIVGAIAYAGTLVNRQIDQQIDEFAKGERDSIGFFGSLASEETRRRALVAREEREQFTLLSKVYGDAGRAAREAGLQVREFSEILRQNNNELLPAIEDAHKELASLQEQTLKGQIFALDEKALSRPFTLIQQETQDAINEVTRLSSVISQLKLLDADELQGEASEAVDRIAKTFRDADIAERSGFAVEEVVGRRREAAQVVAIQELQTQLEDAQARLRGFTQDTTRAALDDAEGVLRAYQISQETILAELAEGVSDSTKALLDEQLSQLSAAIEDQKAEIRSLRDEVFDLDVGSLVPVKQIEDQILDAARELNRAGRLTINQVIREGPELQVGDTFETLLLSQLTAQEDARARILKLQEERKKRLVGLEKELNDEVAKGVDASEKTLERLKSEVAKTRSDIATSDFLREGGELPLERLFTGVSGNADEATAKLREVGEQVLELSRAGGEVGVFGEEQFKGLLEILQSVDGRVSDITTGLRAAAIAEIEEKSATPAVLAALEERARLSDEIRRTTTARLKVQEQLVGFQKGLVDLTTQEATELTKKFTILSSGWQEAQQRVDELNRTTLAFESETIRRTEAFIKRLLDLLTRLQVGVDISALKAKRGVFEAARAIAAFDREEEKIRRRREAEDLRVATRKLALENQRAAVLERLAKIRFRLDFGSFETTDQQVKSLEELRAAAEKSLEPLQDVQSALRDLDEADIGVGLERGLEDRQRAIQRLRNQANQLFAQEAARKANLEARKAGSKLGTEYLEGAEQAIAQDPPANLIPRSFIRELQELDKAITEAANENATERARQLENEFAEKFRSIVSETASSVKSADDALISLLEEQARLLNERLTQAAQNAKSNIDLVRSSLEQALASLREFRQFAESEDPLERAIAPAASLDRSQALLDIRRAELALFPARKATLDQELKLQQLAAKTERDRIANRRKAIDLEERRGVSELGNARSEEAIAADRALLAEQERAVDASLRAAEQTRRIELEKLEIARKRLIVETSILPTAVLARTADDLAAKFAELLQGYLPSVFETAAKAAFSKISEGVVALEELLGVDILPNLGNAEPSVVIEDKFGTTLKDIVDAIENVFGKLGPAASGGDKGVVGAPAGSAGSSGSTGIPSTQPRVGSGSRSTLPTPAFLARVLSTPAGKALTSAFLASAARAADISRLGGQGAVDVDPNANVLGGPVDFDPSANVPGGPVDPDPNANVDEPFIGPEVSSAFGVIFTQYKQAVELLSNAILKAADVFTSKVVNPLLDVSFAGIDNLLGGLADALGILTDLGQTFEAQVITRGPRGSGLTNNLQRREAAEVFSEERARREGLIPRQSGEGSAARRAIRSLEKAAKDALKLAERILDGLPQIVDKFIDLLVERGPELIEKAGQALVLVVRKLLQRLPEIVRALVPVIADVVILLVEGIIDNLPSIIEAFADLFLILAIKAGELFGRIVQSIARNFDDIIKSIVQAFPKIIAGLIVGVASGVATAVVEVLKGLIPGSGSFSGGLFGAGLGALAGGLAFGPVGALVGGGLGSLFGSIFHDGGEVTKAGTTRQMRKNLSVPSIGDRLSQTLRSDEVPAVLQVGERVLSRRQVASLGGQSGIDQLLAGNAGPTEVNSNVVLSYQPTGDDPMDMLAQMLLHRMQVRATTNVARNTRAGSRPARGRN